MPNFTIEKVGLVPYKTTFDKMIKYTTERNENSRDLLLWVEHEPVFSQGRHGRAEHILNPSNIPIFQSDRGGQVTYHGPGQAVIYFVFDIKRLNIGIKKFVELIEQATLKLLKEYNIPAHLIDGQPGVYVNNEKIASLGLRVKNGKTYHGLSINVDMDLTPFSYINPCGYNNLKMTQIKNFKQGITLNQVYKDFSDIFKTT
jgi:lipoyl(octanoyl) transferase